MKSKHTQKLIEIVNSPHIVGIEKPIFSAREVNLFRNNGEKYGEIDCLIFDGHLYHIEYKSSDNQRQKAIDQLQKQRAFIRKVGYNGELHSLLICGDRLEEMAIKYSFVYNTNKFKKIKNGI